MSRFNLKIKQSSNKYLSPWKISYILDNLTSEYYKKYVLDQLTEKLEDLPETQIPIIFNGSFDLYNQYSKLKNFNINNRTDTENFYYLGDLVSLKPNIKIKKIELIFKLHRDLYSSLKKIDIKMDRSKILDYIWPNFNINEEINLENLLEYIILLLGKDNDKLKTEIHKKIDKTKKEFDIFLDNLINFKLIDEMNEKEFDEFLKNPANKNFVNKYYNAFFDTYIRYSRPIIAIFDTEKGTLNILAIEFIKESLLEGNSEKIEIKEISKNSPTLMDIMVGYIAIGFLANTILLGLGLRKNRLEKQSQKNDGSDKEVIAQEVINLREAMSGIEKFTHENKFNKYIVNIEDYKIKRNLKKVNNNINDKIIETLDKNEFLNPNVKITTVENPSGEQPDSE
ncbi:hypothetical protein [Lysinibacillus sp. ZYM-1]|uniref:hypothetical protein n=1 Tax=Lysinibacillus sp. ZYM-1 TaxID=1681184 RepID=UPI0006CE6A78|nr:hypothetical protein [Lysinibacillus sp. ZYM-1]KPN89508.1 hypothetical protein AO843_08750 [Lysinibacillus sp. ZYM-1]